MKPRTKLQFEVWDLHKRLPSPKEHEPFVISNHKFYYTTHYKNLVCLECNHLWRPEKPIIKKSSNKETCPNCKKKLNYISTQNGGYVYRIVIFSIANVVDRFQVIRYFSCWKFLSKKERPKYNFKALFEEWKDWDKNKTVIVGRTQSWGGDGFSYSDYEIRGYGLPRYSSNPYISFESDINCPGAELLPRFAKYGLTKHKHNVDYRFLLRTLENSSKAETLFKARQYSLLYRCGSYTGDIYRYWKSIKICLRNKYKVKDASIYIDYLNLLDYFGKDLHNAKYVCPSNLNKEHDRLVAKKNEKIKREKLERQRREMAQAEEMYKKMKAAFIGLQFSDGEITVKVLENVQEFLEEGDELRHCVFTNEYYKKPDSLVLSARVNEKPIETIEVSLKTMKILQARGVGNKATEYNERIVNLVKKNLKTIKSIAKKKEPLKQLAS